jgi:hypothetical protein
VSSFRERPPWRSRKRELASLRSSRNAAEGVPDRRMDAGVNGYQGQCPSDQTCPHEWIAGKTLQRCPLYKFQAPQGFRLNESSVRCAIVLGPVGSLLTRAGNDGSLGIACAWSRDIGPWFTVQRHSIRHSSFVFRPFWPQGVLTVLCRARGASASQLGRKIASQGGAGSFGYAPGYKFRG